MAQPIIPFARALYLCDYVFGYENGKTDLYGLFNAIRGPSFPHTQQRFCVFAQLVGGLGAVDFFVDIVELSRDELIRTTETQKLNFPNRTIVVQFVLEIQGCIFPTAGDYLVQLWCENNCVADVPLLLH